MKLYQAILGFVLVILGSGALAQTVLVDIFNNTVTDLCVAGKVQRECQKIPSRHLGRAPIRNVQWIQFGMETYRFNFPRFWLKPNLRLQAEPSGKLYLVPPEIPLPASVLPKQPIGFPLEPTRKVDPT